MKKLVVAAIVSAIVSGLAFLSAPTANAISGNPDGQGANACHLLFEGGQLPDATQIGGVKYNVGNPEQVLIAGDCEGGPITLIDDGLSLTVSNPASGSSDATWNFYDTCGGSNHGGPAIDVTDMFKTGTNSFSLALDNDCGGHVSAPALYLVVIQHVE